MTAETEYNQNAIKFISHEIKNQLSICELYTEIIKKTCIKEEIFNLNIMKSLDCIKNSIKMSNNSLLELKSCDTTNVEITSPEIILTEAINFAKVYGIQKEVEFVTKIGLLKNAQIDKLKLTATIINLIKNACEAFENEDKKIITITAIQKNNHIEITVSNNAKPINEPDKIFTEGYTTKSTGNGLGLIICKQNIEKMNGQLELSKSDNTETTFKISLKSC